MTKILQSVCISTFLLLWVGCAAKSSETAAADARAEAASARIDAANADARVEAADARVKAADADARIKPERAPAAKAADNTVKSRLAIPSGTLFNVVLLDSLSSETNSQGDRFLATLVEPVVIDGATVLPKGTKVRGRVVGVEGSGRVKGLARMDLALTDILQGEKTVAITTNTLNTTADSSKTRDGEIIAGVAGIGAAIGAIAGGGKGAAIGAVTGGGAGTGVVLATKGKEIHFGPETRLNFTLANSVHM